MYLVTRTLGYLFVILVVGIVLFGAAFAAGYADFLTEIMNGIWVFFSELGNNDTPAQG